MKVPGLMGPEDFKGVHNLVKLVIGTKIAADKLTSFFWRLPEY
jgi:hypothetical protein